MYHDKKTRLIVFTPQEQRDLSDVPAIQPDRMAGVHRLTALVALSDSLKVQHIIESGGKVVTQQFPYSYDALRAFSGRLHNLYNDLGPVVDFVLTAPPSLLETNK